MTGICVWSCFCSLEFYNFELVLLLHTYHPIINHFFKVCAHSTPVPLGFRFSPLLGRRSFIFEQVEFGS